MYKKDDDTTVPLDYTPAHRKTTPAQQNDTTTTTQPHKQQHEPNDLDKNPTIATAATDISTLHSPTWRHTRHPKYQPNTPNGNKEPAIRCEWRTKANVRLQATHDRTRQAQRTTFRR